MDSASNKMSYDLETLMVQLGISEEAVTSHWQVTSQDNPQGHPGHQNLQLDPNTLYNELQNNESLLRHLLCQGIASSQWNEDMCTDPALLAYIVHFLIIITTIPTIAAENHMVSEGFLKYPTARPFLTWLFLQIRTLRMNLESTSGTSTESTNSGAGPVNNPWHPAIPTVSSELNIMPLTLELAKQFYADRWDYIHTKHLELIADSMLELWENNADIALAFSINQNSWEKERAVRDALQRQRETKSRLDAHRNYQCRVLVPVWRYIERVENGVAKNQVLELDLSDEEDILDGEDSSEGENKTRTDGSGMGNSPGRSHGDLPRGFDEMDEAEEESWINEGVQREVESNVGGGDLTMALPFRPR